MPTRIARARWLALILVASLALAGCFRTAGEDLPPTQRGGDILVSQNQTQVAPPTNTPPLIEPTAEVVTALPSPIATLSPFPTLSRETNTPLPTLEGQGGLAGPVATRTPQVVAIAPTFTPPPTQVMIQPTLAPQATFTPLPTYTMQPTFTPLPTQVAVQPTNPPLPANTRPAPQPGVGPTVTFTPVPYYQFPSTATYTPYPPSAVFGQPVQPSEAIPLGEQPTLSPGGQGGPFETPVVVAQVPTATSPFVQPTFPPPSGPTLTGGQMTATQIVYGATATAAFLMGTQLPAPTPFGQQPVQPGQVFQPGQYPPNVTLVTATPLGQPGMCAEHRISIGETLTRIAARYGVTAQAIATANGIVNPDLIEAGDTLQIPCAAAAATPAPTVPGQTTTTTTTGQQVYIVQAGDNIYRISLRFGVDMGELVALNGLNEVTMNTIYVGQQLTIPASAVIVATPGPGTPLPAPTLTPFIIVVTSAPPGSIG